MAKTTQKTTKKKTIKPPRKKVRKKKIIQKKTQRKKKVSAQKKTPKYWEAVGRRKTAVARVRIFQGQEKKILINDKEYNAYFSLPELWQLAISPLKTLNLLEKFGVSAKVKGGGISSQAEAIRHGLARALVKLNEQYRPKLRRLNYLTRDPRMRERKKFGLKRARRAPQWSKR